jgi:hypothetical protein
MSFRRALVVDRVTGSVPGWGFFRQIISGYSCVGGFRDRFDPESALGMRSGYTDDTTPHRRSEA